MDHSADILAALAAAEIANGAAAHAELYADNAKHEVIAVAPAVDGARSEDHRESAIYSRQMSRA